MNLRRKRCTNPNLGKWQASSSRTIFVELKGKRRDKQVLVGDNEKENDRDVEDKMEDGDAKKDGRERDEEIDDAKNVADGANAIEVNVNDVMSGMNAV